MKQENGKKSKKWLWLVIALAALLAAAGVALALLLPGGVAGGNTDGVDAELYWNIDGAHYMEISEVPGFSARTPAEDGNYYINFAYRGQQVELQIVDKQLVNYIDNMTLAGLVFDDSGVVVDAVDPKTVATEKASDFYVQKVDGNNVVINSSRALNGMTLELTLTDTTGIYDVTGDGEFVGAAGEMGIMDRVLVYSDRADENITHIFILERPVEAGIYWRVERLYDTEKKVSTRVPDENGVYTMEFAHEGEVVELKCKDKYMVDDIDSRAPLTAQFAFLFDEEGFIVEMTDIALSLRGKQLAADFHITAVNGDSYTATRISEGSDQGKVINFKLAENCKIFQCCQQMCYEHNCGERVDTLQELDRVNIYANVDGEAILIFITRRCVESEFYYNHNRQYGGADKGTTRAKQSDGYYHFEMLVNGKLQTVRANKELADEMDAISNGCMGLKLNGNIVERVYNATCVTGGSELSGIVTMLSGPVMTLTSAWSGTSWNTMLSGNCVIYNAVNGEYGKAIGGTMDIKVGDSVATFRDYANQICIIFVKSRPIEGAKVYYNLNRMYDSEKQETTRKVNDEDYYEFLMATEGKQVTVKTKDKGMASYMDAQLAPLVGLKVNKNGIVTNAYSVDAVVPNSAKSCNYRYVENVTKTTFNTYYVEAATQKRVDDTTTWNIAKDCQVYNVSTAYAQFRGEKATLKNGDYIQAIRNIVTNEITHIFIMQRDPTYGVKSYNANCAHCGKNVTWKPYGGKDIPVEDAHYFLCCDLGSSQKSIGKKDDDKFCEVVIDLQGYTINSTSRTFLIYDKLTVMDTKGGGKLVGTTPNTTGVATSGSCMMLGEGGKLDIMGGELTISDKSTAFGEYGGILYLSKDSEVNMTGGKISGGTANNMGGNVAILGGTFNMSGGVIENGTAPNGGCIRLGSGKFIMTGGTVDGSITRSATGILELSGAPVIKGAGLSVTAGTKLDVSKLSKDASIAVQATGIFTEVLDDVDSWLNVIKPGKEGDKIIVKNGALCYIVSGPPSFVLDQDGDGMAVCPVCGGEEVAWTAVNSGERVGAGVTGHFYIKENVTDPSAQFATTIEKTAVVCIHLNGKTVQTAGRIATVGSGGTINIMGDGTIIGRGSYTGKDQEGYTEATLIPNSGGSINLYDNVTVTTTAAGKPVVSVKNNANIKLYDNAKIQHMENGEGIVIEKGKLTVDKTWNGSAMVKFPADLVEGVVSKSYALSTGNYTGTLTLSAEGNPQLVALKGGIALEGATGGAPDFVLDPDGDGMAVCPVCGGEEVMWTAVGASEKVGSGQSGHFYMIDNCVDATSQFATTTAKSHVLCIHLNGKTVTTSGRIATVGDGGTINIMGSGTITGRGSYTGQGQDDYTAATLIPNSGGTINLYDDVVITTTAAGKPVVKLLNNGKLNLHGNATIANMDGGEGIEVVKGKLIVTEGWNGTALVKFPTALVNGFVPAANGESTGDFTGILGLSAPDFPLLVAKNGGLALENAAGGDEPSAPPAQQSGFVLDPDGDGKAVCPVCGGEEVKWTAVYAGERVGAGVSGHFYIAEDGTGLNSQYATTTSKDAVVCIHMNGKTLTTCGRIATVGDGGTINIMGNGTIIGAGTANSDYTDATLIANSGGSINLYDDVTVKTTATGKPVVKVQNNGNIRLYNNATIVNLDGGEGIEVVKGKLTVAAGWNGSALVKFPASLVEGVVPAANGISTGNFTGTLTLNAEGNPKLVAKDGGLVLGDVAGGEEPPAQQSGFVLDPDGDGKAVCPVCGGAEVQWIAVTDTYLGANVTDGGHYYLANDFDSTAQFLTMTGNKTVCFHLNGKNLTYPSRMFVTGSTLNMMGDGTVTSTATTAENLGGLVAAYGDGVINLYGGTYRTTNPNGMPIVTVYGSVTAKVNVYDGATVESVLVQKGTLHMSGESDVEMVTVMADGKLSVADDWTGTAKVAFENALVDGVVPAANGISTGNFTGTLTLNAEGNPKLVAKDGGLALETTSGTQDELVLDANKNGYCEVCEATVQWTDLNSLSNPRIGFVNSKPSDVAAADYVVTDHYHFYLSDDLNYTRDLQFAERYYNINCLHLNGHSLTLKTRLRVGDGATMNIMGTGSIISSCTSSDATFNNALFYVSNSGVLNLYSGSFACTNAAASVVFMQYNDKTALNIKGDVSIVGGVKTADKGTVSLYDTAAVDKIEIAANAKLSVDKDWTGRATVKFANALVDGVVPAANGVSNGDFTGTLTLQAEGNPVLKHRNGGLATQDPIQEKIAHGKAVAAAATAMDFSDANNLPTTCPACGAENVTWTAVATNNRIGDAAEGHYYLPADVNCPAGWTQYVTAKADSTVCLHLNNKNLTYGGRIALTHPGSTLNIMGTGTVTSTGECTNATYNTAALYLEASNTTLNLYGGTFTATKAGQYVLQTRTETTVEVNIYDAAILVDGSTTDPTATRIADPTIMQAVGTINMYGGQIKDGTGTAGGNLRVNNGAAFNMYAGEITNGVGNYGGNVSLDAGATFTMKGGTISGGVSTGGGGNVYLKGSLIVDGGTITGGSATGGSGGNVYAYNGNVEVLSGSIADGKTIESASHGGNISMTVNSTLVVSGGSITGGEAIYQGGNVHISGSAFTMTGGEISGGTAKTSTNHNVWIYTGSMTMTGGTIMGVDGTASAGTAIYLSAGTTLNLGGTATVARNDGIAKGNIYIPATAKLNILNDYTGNASVRLGAEYRYGATIDAVNAQCGSLSGTTFTAGGSYLGTIVNEYGDPAKIVGTDGALSLEAQS